MKNFRVEEIIGDIKEVVKRCGITIYTIQFLMIVFSIYNTYQLYSTYPKENVSASFEGFIVKIIEMLVTAILTIIMITVINNIYERIEFDYKEVLICSIRKLPRFILGFIIFGGILIVAFIIYSFMLIFLGNIILPIISILIFVIIFLYIMMRFSLIIYILILENDTSLVNRSREFYAIDKSLIIRYFFITLFIGIIPAIFILIPGWLGIELSKSAFLITRLIINLVRFILGPLGYILGLLIYKQYYSKANG